MNKEYMLSVFTIFAIVILILTLIVKLKPSDRLSEGQIQFISEQCLKQENRTLIVFNSFLVSRVECPYTKHKNER